MGFDLVKPEVAYPEWASFFFDSTPTRAHVIAGLEGYFRGTLLVGPPGLHTLNPKP